MATQTSTSKNLLSRLSTNISIQSSKSNISSKEYIKSITPSTGSPQIQNLPTGISVTSVSQNPIKIPNDQNVPKADTIAKLDDDLWNKFEQFRQWQESVSAPLAALKPSFISSTPIRNSLSTTFNPTPNKTTPHPSNSRVNRKSLPTSQGSIRHHFQINLPIFLIKP